MCTNIITANNTPMDGSCGIASGAVYYGENSLNSGHVDLCVIGEVI
jgi:hypothetical protein